jgi:amidase
VAIVDRIHISCAHFSTPHGTNPEQLKGLPVAPGTIGIMAKDVSSVDLVFKALLESEPWREDPNVIELPWRTEKHGEIARRAGEHGHSPGKLVFGLMACDGNVRPHQNVARAIEHVKEALEEEGHEICCQSALRVR